MDTVREWAYSVAAVVVFGTLAETLMPGGAYRKYIHLVLGLILILSMIRPVSSLLGGDTAPGDVLDFGIGYTDSQSRTDYIENRQREDVINIYVRTLENNIKSRLETKYGLHGEIISVDVKASADSGGDYGAVEEVSVAVTEKGAALHSEITETVFSITEAREINVTVD